VREKDLDKFKASRKGKLKEDEFKQLQQAIDRHTWHLQKLLRAKKRLKDDTLTIAQVRHGEHRRTHDVVEVSHNMIAHLVIRCGDEIDRTNS
jgi:hypothetical protein